MFTKYGLFMVMIAFLIVVTLYAQGLGLEIEGGLIPPDEFGFSQSGLYDFVRTFFAIITFRIEGIPLFINLIFIVIAFGIVYMIVDIVKDVIPFT